MSFQSTLEGRVDALAQKLARESGMATVPGPAQSPSELNGLDPREVVEVRFFLKPEELDEASVVRRGKSNSSTNKSLRLLIYGFGALLAGSAPYFTGSTWSAWWQHQRQSAIIWGGLLILNTYFLLGQPAMKKLNHFFNRLDVERRICVSHRGIDITHGRLRLQKTWKDFSF